MHDAIGVDVKGDLGSRGGGLLGQRLA